MLCSGLGPSLQGCGVAGVCAEKSNKASEGTRKQDLWGVSEGIGALWTGKEEAEGRTHPLGVFKTRGRGSKGGGLVVGLSRSG